MNPIWRTTLAVAGLAIATQTAAQVTFYEHPGFRGQTFTADRPIGNLERAGFANRASSAVVASDQWQVCDGPGFTGRCAVLQPGRYDSLGAMGLNDSISSVRPVAGSRADVPIAGPGYAPGSRVILFGQPAFQGRSFSIDRTSDNLQRFGDRAESLEVVGEPWEICGGVGFSGRCVVLRPGTYPSLAGIGFPDGVSSARAVDARIAERPRYVPPPVAAEPPRYVPAPTGAQVTFYEHQGMQGQSFTTDRPIGNLERFGFNNRASAAVVAGEPWEVCDGAGFTGRCVVLRPGQYTSLGAMGLNDSVSSARPVGRGR